MAVANKSVKNRPVFESRAFKPRPDGRVRGIDGTMWLFRTVPQGSIRDAKSVEEALNISTPLAIAFSELSALATTRGINRQMARKKYREFQLLVTNYPKWYQAPKTSKIRGDLNRWFKDLQVLDRRVMIGVPLVPTTGDGTFKGFIQSVEQTLFDGGGVLESDFDKDFAQVAAAMDRAGLGTPTPEDWAAADGWWNLGDPRPIGFVPHPEHIHMFSRSTSWQEAEDEGLEDCDPWADLPDHRAITFASLHQFDLGYTPVSEPTSWWAADLLNMGARVISVRGFIEPPTITQQELKSTRRKVRHDLEEGYQKGKDQARREEREAEITQIEAQYDMGKQNMPPTIVDMSVIVGLAGIYNDDEAIRVNSATLHIMSNRQLQAWHETMICSNVRGNPNLHDVPATTLAYSGVSNLTRVGDPDGAFLGLTHDLQPAYLNPTAASAGDAAPLLLVSAATGAGKLLTLDTPIPTPDGWTTMGELSVGDEVLSRAGKPTRVLSVSDVNERPELYKVTLSDGQTFKADRDHQWVVSDFAARLAPRRADHRAAIARRADRLAFAATLRDRAGSFAADDVLTYRQLTAEVAGHTGSPWNTAAGVYQALRFMEVPTVEVQEAHTVSEAVVSKTDPAKLYPTKDTLLAAATRWEGDGGRWREQSAARAKAATALLERELPAHVSTRVLGRELAELGAPGNPRDLGDALSRIARDAGHQPVDGFMEVTLVRPDHERVRTVHGFNARLALGALASRVEFLASEEFTLDPTERILTTGEMLAEGLVADGGQANFAIRVSAGLDLPEADLPVAPYTMGAWLGDGSTGKGGFTGVDPEIWENIEADGYQVTHRDNPLDHYILGVIGGLREAGVSHDKRIPVSYLRASYEQRLAVLQGLMDTDGTIDESGGCELSLSKRDLAEDALELIRSLGIKATMTQGETSYVYGGERLRGKDRYRIHFTTTVPVFRLARKAERLPVEVRETQKWLYVKSVEAVESEPGRCIQVDSEDATYLAGQFTPTHNTVLLQWIARQHALMGTPTVIIDPKGGSDLRAAFMDIPGFRVVDFADLINSDGGLDPLTFYPTPMEGVTLASESIFNVNPWGSDDRRKFEPIVANAIREGVELGAKVTGQALLLAYQAGHIPAEVLKPILDAAKTSAMFRATIGFEPPKGGSTLASSNSLTLFMRGNAPLTLPPQGREIPEAEKSSAMRQSVNLLRLLLRGSLVALQGRGGVIHMDEAWTIERAAPTELEETGRLARSMQVLPILYTQTPTGPLNLGLKGYFSRGLIGHIADQDQAAAGLELFGAARQETHQRVIAPDTLAGDQGANWNSLKALWTNRDHNGKRKLLRGSEFYYGDLKQRFAAVTVTMPEDFLKQASTTPEEVAARLAAQRQAPNPALP